MSERGRETSMGESAGVQARLRRRRMREKEEGKAWDKAEKKVVGFEEQGEEDDKENSKVGIPIASGSPPTDQESLLRRRRMRKKEGGKATGKGEKKVVGFEEEEEEEEEEKENRQGWIPIASAAGSASGSGSGSPPTDQESEIVKKLVEASSASSAAVKGIRKKKRRSNQKKNRREEEKDKVSRQSNQFHPETNITLSLKGVGRKEPVKISECSSSIVDSLVEEDELKKRKGSLGGFHKSSKEDKGGLPDIVFILRSADTDLCNVYTLDTGDLTLKLLVENFSCSYGMSFVASKSTLYAVGGEFDQTDFWTCDLTDWRNKDSFRWEEESSRPTFLGGQLPPVLVALDGKIYALASDDMYGTTKAASRFDDSVEKFRFEVFEPGRGWQALPPPPFSAFYNDSGSGKTKVLWVHWGTVIEKTIYVGVGPMQGSSHHRELYSYDVVSRVWAHIIPGHKEPNCCDLIISNLLKCPWPYLRFEVANNLYFEGTVGYSKTDVRVYVWDLAAKDEKKEAPAEEVVVKRENQLRDESSSASTDGDREGYDSLASTLSDASTVDSDVLSWDDEYASPDDDNRVDIESSSGIDDSPSSNYTHVCPAFVYPVCGLESVTGLVEGGFGTKAFVAHLADNVYCLAYFYPSASGKGNRIRVCTFRAIKQQNHLGCLVRAKILRRTRHIVSPGLAFEGHWCTFCK